MPQGAVRCNACSQRQDWKKLCINCGGLLADTSRFCTSCQSHQDLNRQCVACGVFIPAHAKICSKCGGVQALGGLMGVSQITLSLFIALLSVLGTVVPVLREALTPDRSETRLQVVGTEFHDKNYLVLLADNSGNLPSYLSDVRIRFSQVPKADRSFEFAGARDDRLINPGKQKLFRISTGFSRSELRLEDPEKFDSFLGGGLMSATVIGTGEGSVPVTIEPGLLKTFLDKRTK
jgi:hypothetical protein